MYTRHTIPSFLNLHTNLPIYVFQELAQYFSGIPARFKITHPHGVHNFGIWKRGKVSIRAEFMNERNSVVPLRTSAFGRCSYAKRTSRKRILRSSNAIEFCGVSGSFATFRSINWKTLFLAASLLPKSEYCDALACHITHALNAKHLQYFVGYTFIFCTRIKREHTAKLMLLHK